MLDAKTTVAGELLVSSPGTCSAWLGLRLAYDAHVQAVQAAEAEDAKWADYDDGQTLDSQEVVADDLDEPDEQPVVETRQESLPSGCTSQ